MPGQSERTTTFDDTVFPLPLTPFEDYMLADDHPGYPMEYFIRLRFKGQFDRAALDAAFSTALSRHPLCRAVVRQRRRHRCWEPAQIQPTVQWLDQPPTDQLPDLGPVDIQSGPGIRIIAQTGANRTDLTLHGHHACADGLGSLRFLEDLLIAYAHNRGLVPSAAFPKMDLEQLRDRAELGLSPRMWPGVIAQQIKALPRVFRFLTKRCEPLAQSTVQSPEGHSRPGEYPVSLTRRLTEAETSALVATCRKREVTVNDVLVAEFLRSLKSLDTRDDPDRQLRTCVPVNIRTAHPDNLSAFNGVSYVFVNRSVRDCEDSRRLLSLVHDQMVKVKRCNRALVFVLWLRLSQKIPLLLKRMCRPTRCMANGVMSNMGRVFMRSPLADRQGRVMIGDLTLESIEPLTPWRSMTSVTLAGLTYAGRLSVTLHYDPRVVSAEQAEGFIDRFIADVNRFPE